jgi:protein TonB
VPIVRVAPAYPLAARTHRTEGRVLVEFTIQADGSVADPTVVEASPAGVFDRAVLQAIRQWRFAPRVEDGQVVSRRARQTVQFSLSS